MTYITCVICGLGRLIPYGIEIENYNEAKCWRFRFRLLYLSDGGFPCMSGVGNLHPHDADLRVPLSYDARWNDEGVVCERTPRRESDTKEYVFHEACWTLVEKAYHPIPPPLANLMQVCELLPLPSRVDHIAPMYVETYYAEVDRYPWEETVSEDRNRSLDYFMPLCKPYPIRKINKLPSKATQPPFEQLQLGSLSTDCLNSLPEEIILEIASHLPTRDIWNARLASPAFYFLFHSHTFWLSRFSPEGDRSWLVEAKNWPKSCDWRHVYRRTTDHNCRRGKQNRKRIWGLIKRIQEMADQRQEREAETAITISNELTWSYVKTGQSYSRVRPNKGKCFNFKSESPCLIHPELISKLGFTTVSLGRTAYIAGIRLVNRRHQVTQLGYVADGDVMIDAQDLHGFELAVGKKGIQGIRCIYGAGKYSQWVGMEDAPKTKRLVFPCQIAAIRAEFDDYNLINMGVAAYLPPTEEKESTLRDLACWYPDYPPASLNLNEESFTAPRTARNSNEPLTRTLFGGPGGIYLKNLTGVTVYIVTRVVGIKFHYNDESVPESCRLLGAAHGYAHRDARTFSIDGPSGEIITSLNVVAVLSPNMKQRNPLQEEEAPVEVTFLTNWGNVHPCKRATAGLMAGVGYEHTVERTLRPAAGSTITGLYCMQCARWASLGSSLSNLTAIGLISETIA